jgi:hypothetical protein
MRADIAPEIYALDLDFTIYRSDLAFDDMVHIAEARGLATVSSLREVRVNAEVAGVSFDLISYLAERRVPQEELGGLLAAFAENSDGKDYLYPDAQLMLDALRKTRTPFFIYTKGGRATQIAKLDSCGLLDEPYLITDNDRKGGDIAGMRAADGLYVVHVTWGTRTRLRLAARSLFLLEDKPRGFEGLPGDCSGVLVRRQAQAKKTQQGTVPARILIAPDLGAATERIRRNAR